ncbi:hypothetical protein GCM10011405_11500 [Rufibacter glacialis]|nr:hypothetical protein GCM10011405_11500 [Rufibacter glacialis]
MPNHVHGIIGLEGEDNLKTKALSLIDGDSALQCKAATGLYNGKNESMANLSPKAGSLSRIIGSYKAACTKMIRGVSTMPFGWQARYHDRIIRNQRELVHIEQYILSNPTKWQEDKFYQP